MPYFFVNRLLLVFLVIISVVLRAELDDYLPQDPGPTSSNYGDTGLFEIPTARMMPEGSLKIGFNNTYPYEMTAQQVFSHPLTRRSGVSDIGYTSRSTWDILFWSRGYWR